MTALAGPPTILAPLSAATVPNLTRRLLEWAGRPANERTLHDEQLPQIEAGLRDPRRLTQLHIAAWLLGTWHLGRGAARVMQGEGEGFDQMRLGAGLQRSALLLRSRQDSLRGQGTPSFAPLHAANAIAFGLALGDPDGEELYARYAALPDSFFGDAAYPLFVRELLKLRAGERPIVTPRLGAWRDALMHWHSEPELLARRLHDVLDVHLDQTAPQRPVANEFEDPPAFLYPVEVLAFLAVRAALGLHSPKVEHPLMFTNLATMAMPPRWPADELLQRIAAVHRRR